MSRERSLLAALMRPLSAAQALLDSDFKLRREGRRLRIVVERPGGESSLGSLPATQAPSAQPAPMDSVTQGMHADLRRLLKQHGKTRELMRHLAYVERALRLDGVHALDKIPLEVLGKSLAQLKSLVTDWRQPGIAELRSRLSILIAAKEEELRAAQPSSDRLSDFFTTTKVQVSEATPSDFRSVEQDWKTPTGL